MTEPMIRNTVEFKTNPDAEQDRRKIYEDIDEEVSI